MIGRISKRIAANLKGYSQVLSTLPERRGFVVAQPVATGCVDNVVGDRLRLLARVNNGFTCEHIGANQRGKEKSKPNPQAFHWSVWCRAVD